MNITVVKDMGELLQEPELEGRKVTVNFEAAPALVLKVKRVVAKVNSVEYPGFLTLLLAFLDVVRVLGDIEVTVKVGSKIESAS